MFSVDQRPRRALLALRARLERIWPRCGLLASAIVILAVAPVQFLFRNPEGDRYSPLNHFISELGWLGVSDGALFFNVCLVLAGPLFAIYLLGLSLQVTGRWAVLFGLSGVAAAMSLSMVGLFPLRASSWGLSAHSVAAGAIAVSGGACLSCFLMAGRADRSKVVPRIFYIAVCVLAVVGLFGGLMVVLSGGIRPHFDREAIRIVDRPEIWTATVVQWFSATSALVLVITSAWLFELRRHKSG